MTHPAGDLDAIVDSWASGAPLSDHLSAEIEWAHANQGHPLPELAPVPGCRDCIICETLRSGGDHEDAAIALTIVARLAQRRPADRYVRARMAVLDWASYGCTLPDAEFLVAAAAKVPGAISDPAEQRDRDPLPIEAARRADILATACRLGLGDPVRRGREYMVRCFMHEDSRPSLRLDATKGLWYCDPCATGGDVIELVRRVRGIGFADAVRELAA